MDFEWDDAKADANLKKHKVSFPVAMRVFLDPFRREDVDEDEHDEVRINVIGIVDSRMLFVTCTMRGDVCRIISARGAEPDEKRLYHEDQVGSCETAGCGLVGIARPTGADLA